MASLKEYVLIDHKSLILLVLYISALGNKITVKDTYGFLMLIGIRGLVVKVFGR